MRDESAPVEVGEDGIELLGPLEQVDAGSENARQGGHWARSVIVAALVLSVTGLTSWSVVQSVRLARRTACMSNLKQIGLAFQTYHEREGTFPAPAIRDARGRSLLSWRVALLPDLGQKALYDRFHHDEPWDSPHNRVLVSEMPAVFGCPSSALAGQGWTSYLVVVGPRSELGSVNTLFEPGRGVDPREVLDGMSTSVLVVESNRHVVWTQPDDLSWTRDGALPRLESPHRGETTANPEASPFGAHILFGDGSVRFVRRSIRPEILRALLTINGGEVTSSG